MENNIKAEGVHYNSAAVRATTREKWIADNLESRMGTGMDEATANRVLGDVWDIANSKQPEAAPAVTPSSDPTTESAPAPEAKGKGK